MPPERPSPTPDAATIERFLLGRIAAELGVPESALSVDRPFMELGLSSLEAVELSAELEDWLGVSIPETVAWEHPTIEKLATYLARGGAAVEPVAGRPQVHAREPIAVVGIGCRLPGAASPAAFWRDLRAGVERIGATPEDRFLVDPHAPPALRRGAFLDDVASFDALRFRVAPHEAERMDPQQRILLEVVWEALEDAQVPPRTLAGRSVGVFVGVSHSDYAHALWQRSHDSVTGTGTALSIVANRVSFAFDLRGPSIAVDTACSSSLVATHLAVRALRAGECEAAVVGGASVMLEPAISASFADAGLLSEDGHCRAFGTGASGYARGEGVLAILLAPLSWARARGLRVRAVIHGSAVNQDGRTNGLLAPSATAQTALIGRALDDAGLAPAVVGYVEAHGTATPLGDEIEARALGAAIGQQAGRTQPLAIGSIKSSLGHLEAAAGLAGLVKTVLAIEHAELPATLGATVPSPRIPFAELGLAVRSAHGPWPGAPRIAGVSAFGFGGTNAHVVLGEAPADAPEEPCRSRDAYALRFSAHAPSALDALERELDETLERTPPARFGDLCLALARGREPLPLRRAVVARDPEDARAALRDPARRMEATHDGRARSLALLLPGLGDQHAGMAAGLRGSEPAFADALELCLSLFRHELDVDLGTVAFSQGAARRAPDLRALVRGAPARPDMHDPLTRTAIAHCALFACEYALAKTWMRALPPPAALLGHSLGEYVAATLAGVFALEDAIRIVARRALWVEELAAEGAMLAVALGEEAGRALCADGVELAAVNGPEAIVLAGPREPIAAVEAALASRRVACRVLGARHAFHTSAMRVVEPRLLDALRQTPLRAPSIPMVSNVTGRWVTDDEARSPEYWSRHLAQAVRFADGVATLLAEPGRVLLEVGPGRTLGSFVLSHPVAASARPLVVGSLPAPGSAATDEHASAEAAARLWLAGLDVDPVAREGGNGRRIEIPSLPDTRRRYWLPGESSTPTPSLAGPDVRAPELARADHATFRAFEGRVAIMGDLELPAGVARIAEGDADAVVVADALGAADEDVADVLAARLAGLARGRRVPVLALLDRAIAVESGDRPVPARAAALGAIDAARHAGLDVRAVEIATPRVDGALAAAILRELGAVDAPRRVALRPPHRWVPHHVPLSVPAAAPSGAWVIVGAGRLATAVAAALGGTRLAIVSRRASALEWALHFVDEDVARGLRSAREALGPLDGVVLAAGAPATSTLGAAVGPAVQARLALLRTVARASREAGAGRVVVLSSISTLLGGLDLGAYAGSHHALDVAAREQGCAVVDWDGTIDPRVARALLASLCALAAPHVVVTAGRLEDRVARAFAPAREVTAPALHGRPELVTPFVAPRGEVEEAIAAAWSEQLGVAELGVHDDFFALGGSSLAGLRIVGAVKARFAVELPLAALFAQPTIAAMAAAVEEALLDEIERGAA